MITSTNLVGCVVIKTTFLLGRFARRSWKAGKPMARHGCVTSCARVVTDVDDDVSRV